MSSPHHVPVSFEEPSSGGDRQSTFWDFDSVPTLRGWGAVCLSVCLSPFLLLLLLLFAPDICDGLYTTRLGWTALIGQTHDDLLSLICAQPLLCEALGTLEGQKPGI